MQRKAKRQSCAGVWHENAVRWVWVGLSADEGCWQLQWKNNRGFWRVFNVL